MSIHDSNIIPLNGVLAVAGVPSQERVDEGPSRPEPKADPRRHVSSALAILQAIGFGELLSALPRDEGDQHRHTTAVSLLGLLEQELTTALSAFGSVDDEGVGEDL